MKVETVDTKELIACYELILDYLKQLETKKKELEKNDEGKN